MDIVLICTLPELTTEWLENIYKFIDKAITQIKLTIDYISNLVIINIINNKTDDIYIKRYSYIDIPMVIKKLNI